MNEHNCKNFTIQRTEHENVCAKCGLVLDESIFEENYSVSHGNPLYERMLGSDNLVPQQITKSRFLANSLTGYSDKNFKKIRSLCSILYFGSEMTRRAFYLFNVLSKNKIQGPEAAFFAIFQTCSEFTKPYGQQMILDAVILAFNAKRRIRPKHVIYRGEWCLLNNQIPFNQNRAEYFTSLTFKDFDSKTQKQILQIHDYITKEKNLNIHVISAVAKWRKQK